jgi:type I restriction enzyme S subunit
VRAQNIKHDCLELDDVAFVSLPDKAEGLRTRVQQGDLLITITGANVTKAALVKDELGTAFVSQHVALCRPTTEILPDYLYWFIVAEAAGRKQLTEMAYGAGKPGLNLENIRSVQVPLPSLSEQQEIVELIQSKLSEADQLDQTLATALQQAEALRQSILKKAFCGQLVNQDKNDEPATRAARTHSRRKAGWHESPWQTGKSREYTVVI